MNLSTPSVLAGVAVILGVLAFSGGEVDFNAAEFSGGMVYFHAAVFTGGVVDVSRPRVWLAPPQGVDGPPPGVRLPSAEHLAKITKNRT